MKDAATDWGLIFAFTDTSPSFASGVEIGMLLRDIQRNVGDIEATVHSANRNVIVRMCAAYGWIAAFRDTDYQEWTTVILKRAARPILTVVSP